MFVSFLSCLNHPGLVIASIGGISLGVTLLLLPWKTVTLQGSSLNQLSSTQSEGNCTIVDFSRNFRKISSLRKKLSNRKDYYYISCNSLKRIKEEWDSIIPNRWEGAFPKSIFKGKAWNKKQKLQVELKELNDISHSERDLNEEEWPYRVTFSFKQFRDLAGKWKYLKSVNVPRDKIGAVVNLTESEQDNKDIYILWDLVLNDI